MKFRVLHITLKPFLLIAALLLALSLTVSAQTLSLPTETAVNLGGSNQEASNPFHDNEPIIRSDNGAITFTGYDGSAGPLTVTLENIIPNPKYSIIPSLTFANPIAIKSQLENDPTLLILELTDNMITGTNDLTIRLEGLIPANLDAVDNLLRKVSFEVATADLVARDGNGTQVGQTFTIPINMQRKNELRISDADAEINGGSKQGIDDGDDIEGLEPEDSVDIEVEVENRYSDADNQQIEDVVIEIDCKDDSDIDFDDNSENVGDISEDDEERETFRFDVEEDAKDGTIDCSLEVDGVDESGARHGEKFEFDIKIERERHEIRIRSLTINPEVATCEDSQIQVSVNVLNIGRTDENNVVIAVSSSELQFDGRKTFEDLNEDDEERETFVIDLPDGLSAGPKTIQVQTLYDNTKLSSSKTIQFENTCGQVEPPRGSTTPSTTGFFGPTSRVDIPTDLIQGKPGEFISVPVSVTNPEDSVAQEFTLSLTNIDEFAEFPGTKKIFLNPGQESTLLVNLKVKEDAAPGKQSVTVNVKSATGETFTETVTVEIESEKEQATSATAIALTVVILIIIIGVVVAFAIREQKPRGLGKRSRGSIVLS